MVALTSSKVWQELDEQLFAIVGMVSAKNEGRTAAVVYKIHDRRLYYTSEANAWKIRHVLNNPNVSVTVPIAKRVWFMPWMKIPSATITFAGTARIVPVADLAEPVRSALFRGLELGDHKDGYCAVEVTAKGDFVTYGVGVSLRTMLDTQAARGRTPVAG